jgi:molybdopterin/thiamine biosynthesis adenylyltransferase
MEGSALPGRAPPSLTDAQRDRYSRHILLPEVGEAGQEKLLGAKVLLLGAGGLGSPAALYLAAAGVGTLGIVDADTVDASNLQRQILHATSRIGTPKVESAAKAIQDLNPDVKVEPYQERLTSANVDRIFAPYDVIVDGCDNFPTRFLVNDASIFLKKPVVHGSIFRFDGQVTTFLPGAGPCYRCWYPEPPPPGSPPPAGKPVVLNILCTSSRNTQATGAIRDHLRKRHAGRTRRHLRLAQDEVSRVQTAAGQELPGLRRVAHDHELHRLRRILLGLSQPSRVRASCRRRDPRPV